MNNSYSGTLALTVGTFDGIHLGHQSLLKTAREIALRRKIKSAAYTYLLPPKRHFHGREPKLLLPPGKKISALEQYVDNIIIGNFDEVKDLPPDSFIEKVLIDDLQVSAVVVGTDWRFGKGRAGSVKKLAEAAHDRYTVHPEQQLTKYGKPISSTWIRNEFKEGNITLCTELLGRSPSIFGEIIRGDKIGTDIGFPTANLKIDDRVLLPKAGSYATVIKLGSEEFGGVTYVGTRPTFEKTQTQTEVHIFDFDDDIYGKKIELKLVEFISPSKKFEKTQHLQKAIQDIVRKAKDILINKVKTI